MNTKFTALLFLLLIISAISCKQKEATPESKEAQNITPVMSMRDVAELRNQADQVDIIFYDHPMSISQDDPASAKNTVMYISALPLPADVSCPAIARLTWMSQGSIIKEANVHLQGSCAFLSFMENNKEVARNSIDPAGIEFFNNVIMQAKQRGMQ